MNGQDPKGVDRREGLVANHQFYLGTRDFERMVRSAYILAIDDGISAAQNSEKGTSPATVLMSALDQARNFDQLYEDALDARQGRNRTQGSEGVITDLNLDVGQRV